VKLWMFDTDHVSLHQRGNLTIIQRMAIVDPSQLAVSIVTVEEQMRGWLDKIRKAKKPEESVMAYDRLKITTEYFSEIQILNFDLAAHHQYLELRKQKIRVGSQDLKIASIALTQDLTLVTRNRRDFEQVPSLSIEDWSIP
jgi:tRNA(fMet)-specific endonuclease VapC